MRLDAHPSRFTERVIARVPRLRAPYRPTPWLRNAHAQIAWLVLREAFAPALRYERTDTLRMRDGGTTALDWLGLDRGPEVPTLVLLHGITGDAQGTRLVARDLQRATGWRVVVCTRRGHGRLPLTTPRFNTMGCTDDLREQLAHIEATVPDSPLHGIGISAGSALLVRYLGEEGRGARLRGGIAYCPGFDIGVAWPRVQPFYSRLMAKRLKRHYLQRHASVLASMAGYERCLATRDIAAFHDQAFAFAGCDSNEAYLARSNPVHVFDRIAVPMLILNADDDPVCVARNAEDHVEAVRRIPDALLVRTPRGSHCAFFEGWRPRSWANALMAEYLLAVHELGGAGRPG